MEKRIWLSADLSKESFHAAVALESLSSHNWTKQPREQFAFNEEGMCQLLVWLERQGIGARQLAGVCVESTGRLSQRFVTLAQGRLGQVSVINPQRSHALGKTLGAAHKTDGMDACLLAYYGQSLRPLPTPERSRAHHQLREMTRAYEKLQSDALCYRQRLEDEPPCEEVCASYKRLVAEFTQEMALLQQNIDALMKKESMLREDACRIATVPGLGRRSAQTLLAEFGDLRLYNRDQLVNLAGLYPRQHESGSSVRKRPRLARGGKGNVRAVLYMAAMSALRSNPAIKAFGERLRAHGKTPMQIIGAAMRKLLLIAHALITTGKDYDPQHTNQLQSKPA